MSDDVSKTHEDIVGTVIHDRYRVDRLLGSGGMGSVYLAEHVLMKKPVAVKVLHPEMLHLSEIVARFEREAIAAGRIDHPNVAGATDFGRLEDGSLYLVLEYVAGHSLSDLLKEGPLPVERVLGLARQIAAALSAAHDAAVVHRDLKPDNVMLVQQPDGRDIVKVLDFGIAKVLDAEPAKRDSKSDAQLTRIGTVMGTASYMSPEQAIGQPVDQRADLYSLGVMLYEMIAGRRPFEGEELAQILAKQLTEVPPPLPQTTPTEVSIVVNKLLEKRPEDRVQSAAELVEIIDGLRLSLYGVVPAGSEKSVTFAAPVSAQPSPQSSTFLDASGSIPDPEIAPPRSRRGPMVAAGLIAIAALGGLWAWMSGENSDESPVASASSMPSSAPAAGVRTDGPGYLARTPPSQRATSGIAQTAAPPSTGSAKPAADTSTTTTSSTETTTVRGANGETVTTKKTTTKTRTTKKRSRRREGPGGIYIPPPSEWF